MVLCGRHRLPQCFVALEMTNQDAQAVQVRVLRRDDLKNGLSKDHAHTNKRACDRTIHIWNIH